MLLEVGYSHVTSLSSASPSPSEPLVLLPRSEASCRGLSLLSSPRGGMVFLAERQTKKLGAILREVDAAGELLSVTKGVFSQSHLPVKVHCLF